MTHIFRPIESDILTEAGTPEFRAAPELGHNARTFVRLRAESLLDAGASRSVLAKHNVDDHNITTAWSQKHAQDAAIKAGTERFIGAFDEDNRLVGAIETVPAAGDQLRPYESPLDLLLKRRTIKPEANAVAVIALLAEKGEGHLDILVDLLRHTVNKYSDEPREIYLGVPAGSSAHEVALEQKFVHANKFARQNGVMHTLLRRDVGTRTLADLIFDEES